MEIVFLVLLIVLMALALGMGFPVAFALPGSAILSIGAAALCGWLLAGDASAYFAQGGPVEWLTAGVTNFRGVYWEVERDTLIAIPLFVFMGIMLQRSKIAEDLLVCMAQLFGPLPGGLGISVVFVGALLAATTGIVGATVVAMGLISLPAMMRNNYSNPLATGTIAASGTLGQIIPPSIVLIILADQLASAVDQASTGRKAYFKETTGEFSMPSEFDAVSTSAGDMFMGAFVPGLVLVAVYMIFIFLVALARPKLAPPVHYEGRYDGVFAMRVLFTLVPPLTLIFVVLGSIITGIATVNQAGAIGAVGATIMAGTRLRQGRRGASLPAILASGSVAVMLTIALVAPINIKSIHTDTDRLAVTLATVAAVVFAVSLVWAGWRTYKIEDTLRSVMIETAKTTSLVFIILLGAAMLTAAFRAFGGEELVKDFLLDLPGGFWMQFFIVMAVIFILGFFLDFIEIAVVVVPIVAPILLLDPEANVTAVWLGVMIGLNIQTSFLTPPFGFALFYLRGVAPPSVKTIQMYKGVAAFIALQLLVLVIVANSPKLVNYLPTRVSLLSDTAPPPVNPRLQYCIEEKLLPEYAARKDALLAAIASARGLDLSYLPAAMRKDLLAAYDRAERTFELVAEIDRTAAEVEKADPGYRPLHQEVRALQRQIAKQEAAIKREEADIGRLQRLEEPDAARISELQADVERLRAAIETERASIPEQWEAEHAAFRKLQKAEDAARKAYRTNVDQAYAPVVEVLAVIDDTDALAALEPLLRELRGQVEADAPEINVERLGEASSTISAVEGTSDIRREVSQARRALRAKTPEPAKAVEHMDTAIAKLTVELEWRRRAVEKLGPGLHAYRSAIADSIGLRQQRTLPRDRALEVADCSAAHRDVSLHF
ncbi:MAG: TRAP transporter large permease subunit [Ectothiorhodospiraceae bacterium]|nr:TRAP transporter large permease subunit [Chromatiales bacterium]MCP5155313.1 TRAP transporter large permease subunit [Ectothiorhodospiraceae bacterium]